VSENLRPYELQRVGMEIILRTDRPHASAWLLNRMKSADLDWEPARVKWISDLAGLAERQAETALDDLIGRALLVSDPASQTFYLPQFAAKFLLDKRPETVAYARRAVEIFTRLRKPDSLTGAWAALQGVFSRNAGVRSQESEGSAQGAAAPSQESLTSPRRSVVRVLVERIAAA